jgi:chromosome condensin MukBEF MukE localization factor
MFGNKNNVKIDGNNNLTFQSLNNSTVTFNINQSSISAVDMELEEKITYYFNIYYQNLFSQIESFLYINQNVITDIPHLILSKNNIFKIP